MLRHMLRVCQGLPVDGAALHRAFESLWWDFFGSLEGALRDRRGDLTVYACPSLPFPQFNGVWIGEYSPAAVVALPQALADVEAAGAQPWVQTRSGQARARQAAVDLGLTHSERVPALLARSDELVTPETGLEIDLVTEAEHDAVNALLADAFGAPADVFALLNAQIAALEGFSLYRGRAGGEIVSTSVGAGFDGAVGVFNVATVPRHRGRGYGAAVTARAARDGFDAGAAFAFLQSSELGHGVYRRLGFRDVGEYLLQTRPG
jgi:ribosomal protein S18 acetylase RimI-like enzyme